jgi:hypothetical protein
VAGAPDEEGDVVDDEEGKAGPEEARVGDDEGPEGGEVHEHGDDGGGEGELEEEEGVDLAHEAAPHIPRQRRPGHDERLLLRIASLFVLCPSPSGPSEPAHTGDTPW